MSTSNIPIKSPFGVREAEENNRKEERLRDYPIEVEGDSVFYTVEFCHETAYYHLAFTHAAPQVPAAQTLSHHVAYLPVLHMIVA